jgi:glycosyltransferase involved in cell wall biosynthesis
LGKQQRIDLAELQPPRSREPLILFVGRRVVPEKGPDMLVAACSQVLPQLAGWRAERLTLTAMRTPPPHSFAAFRKRRARQGVAMAGYLERSLVLKANARASIAVVPSRWAESFGLAALALASGTALVTSGRGGLREVAGDAALYVDPDNPAAIADAILTLARDAALREALGAAGRERSRQFDVRVAVSRLAVLRRDVLRRDSTPTTQPQIGASTSG